VDVGFARVQPIYLGHIDIKAGYAKSLLAEEQYQWETHVAKPDNPYPQFPLLY
jgi:hypothetical protein